MCGLSKKMFPAQPSLRQVNCKRLSSDALSADIFVQPLFTQLGSRKLSESLIQSFASSSEEISIFFLQNADGRKRENE